VLIYIQFKKHYINRIFTLWHKPPKVKLAMSPAFVNLLKRHRTEQKVSGYKERGLGYRCLL